MATSKYNPYTIMKNSNKNKKNYVSGFTAIETLVGISIFVTIALVLTLFSRNTWIYSAFLTGGLADADAGRQILKTVTSEIRTASTGDTGAYAISGATATTLTFYSDIDHDNLKERVRYFLSGTSLKKGVIKPTGSPLTYNVANETISTIAEKVTNATIFQYYDRNYDGTTSALPSPVNIPDVRLVKITLTIDTDPNRSPIPKTFSTQVSIRNLKDNL